MEYINDILWCLGSLFMAWVASTKLRSGMQPNGARLVIALAFAQVVAVTAGQEIIAYLACGSMMVVALLLIIAERRWRKQNKPAPRKNG